MNDMDDLRNYGDLREHELNVIFAVMRGMLKETNELTADDFSCADAGRVFDVCRELQLEQQRKLDEVTIKERLKQKYDCDTVERLMAIVRDAAGCAETGLWLTSVRVTAVQGASKRRMLCKLGNDLANAACDFTRKIDTILDEARTTLRNAVKSDCKWITMATAMQMAFESLEKSELPMATGIKRLDRVLNGGLRRGELTILGARPAVGKTAMLLSIALAAARQGRHVLFFEIEMSPQQMGSRAMSAESGINCARFLNRAVMTDEMWGHAADAYMAATADKDMLDRVHIRADGSLTIERIKNEVQTMVDAGTCDLVLIDYLQLVRTSRRTNSSNATLERLELISRELKAITLDCNVAVLAAAQLKRPADKNEAPTMDELRGSGSLEQDADNVILMHRPEKVENMGKCSDDAKTALARAQGKRPPMDLISLDVGKQRQGCTGLVWAVFDGAHMRYLDINEI